MHENVCREQVLEDDGVNCVCLYVCVYVCMRLSAHLFYDAHSFERPHH